MEIKYILFRRINNTYHPKFNNKINLKNMSKSLLFIRIRLTTFLLICTTVGVSAQVLAMAQRKESRQTQSLPANRVTLSQLLDNLEVIYKVRFNYKASLLKNVQVENTSIQAFKGQIDNKLNELLSEVNLKCEVINVNSFVIIPKEKDKKEAVIAKPKVTDQSPNASTLADETITGKVVDENGEGIPGASIIVKGTTRGTTTNSKGEYSITVPDEKSVISLSSIGYESQNIIVGSRKIINVSLSTSTKGLSEVVVVGYGTRKKSELSGAVTQINADLITKQPIASIDQGLAGLVPGLTLREGSGAPGSGPEILIRGINGFGTNKPLVVIDDVIFENGNDQLNNPLALINPEDIENVTILKDAATKAIYGSRATAGVIIVTTKKGKLGKPKITFNSSFGTSSVLPFERPDVLNASEIAQFYKDVNIDRIRASNPLYKDITVSVPNDLIPAQYRDPASYGVGTNWFDAVIQTANVQNYNISVSGGTDNLKYFVSANYLNQPGVVLANGLTRVGLRANVDVKISKKLSFGLNLSPSRTDRDRSADEPGNGGFSAYSTITSTYWTDPSASIFDATGNYNPLTKGALTTNWTANPVYQLYAEQEKRRVTQILMGTYLEFEPIKNLKLRTNFAYNYSQGRSRNFQPSGLVADGNLTPVIGNLDGARAVLFNDNKNNFNWDNTISYRLIKNKHDFTILGGWALQEQTNETSSFTAKRLIDENLTLPDFNNVDKTVIGNFVGNEAFGQNRLVSLISRANYIYGGKYFLNLSLRRDGSSRFGREVQYGNFPAGSVGWNISNEKFMSNLKGKFLDNLKINVGYGITGNNSITDYGHLGSVGSTTYLFGGVIAPGNTLGSLPNPFVTWEESKQFDMGLTGSLFKEKVSFEINLYEQITEGALAAIPLSWIAGQGGYTGNQKDSRIRNQGFEVSIDYTPIRKNDFVWTTSLNFSKYNNKILSYFDPRGFLSGQAGNGTSIAISRPGDPIGMLRGLQTLGLFTKADIENPTVPKYAGAIEGSQKYLDGDGDGRLEIEDDYVILGSPHPDLMFGWNNQVKYRGFNFRATFAGQLGGKIYDLRREIMWNVDGNFNIDRQMLDRFRPGDDPTTKTFPTTVSLTGSTTRYVRFPSDNKLYDGSYVALKNIYLGYNLGRLLSKNSLKFFNTLEVYASARNVFYLSSYKFGNPEVRRANDGSALRSVNYGSYPISRTFTMGLNITF